MITNSNVEGGSELSIELYPSVAEPAWMISARSFLVDRFTPDFERILIPTKTLGGGRLDFRQVTRSVSRLQSWRKTVSSLIKLPETPISGLYIDLRRDAPQNWAHFVTIHLPIVFLYMNLEKIDFDNIKLILPKNTPNYILSAADIFGLATVCTDNPVTGDGIMYDLTHADAIRNQRVDWVHYDFVRNRLDKAISTKANIENIPDKIFLARKDTRRIINEESVFEALKELGYKKIYAEDFSAIEQFCMFERAESIVAAHGAAIAPLLFRKLDAKPLSLVEIFPCGHITNNWRTVAQQVGTHWIGVRGRIRPEHIKEIYRLDRPYRRHSLQDYEVDPDSVLFALEWINQPTPS